MNNVTRVNGALLEARKGKEKKKAIVTERPKRVSKPVPESLRPSQSASGASKRSKPASKRSHSHMKLFRLP